ncbi:MAG: branched-chain amino acid ABC transporter permease [Ruminococcus sp.]
MNKSVFKSRNFIIGCIVSVILFIAYQIVYSVTGGGYIANIIVYICLFVIAGQGWNLLGGYIGEISFGHAVFFGLGSYTIGIVQKMGFSGNPLLLVILGMLICAVFALIISYPLLRIRGFSFLIGTFGLGVIFYNVFKSNQELGSNQGMYIKSLDKGFIFSLIVILAIVISLFVYVLVNNNLGLKFKAVRDASDAAEMIGINIYRTKTIALVIGAAITGLAGGMFALYSSHIAPSTCFETAISNDILLGSYIGGCGTVIGPVIGGFTVLGLQEWARNTISVSGGHNLVLGLLLIVVMMVAREGIWPECVKAFKKLRLYLKNKKKKKSDNYFEKEC